LADRPAAFRAWDRVLAWQMVLVSFRSARVFMAALARMHRVCRSCASFALRFLRCKWVVDDVRKKVIARHTGAALAQAKAKAMESRPFRSLATLERHKVGLAC